MIPATWTPPAIVRHLRRKLFPPQEIIHGYEHADLINTVFHKTRTYDPRGDWPLMIGVSTVLDFGGGCGLHYKLASKHSPNVRWAVVETPAMVRRASELTTKRLAFFTDIAEAARWLGRIDIMHSNGALQYTPDPLAVLNRLCDLGAKKMVWERVLLSKGGVEKDVQTSFLGDNGPGFVSIPKEKIVRYPRIRIAEKDFLAAHRGYELMQRGSDWFWFLRYDPPCGVPDRNGWTCCGSNPCVRSRVALSGPA